MVIVTDRTLALRCPSCGKLAETQISVFSFSGRKTLRVQCTCGAELFVIGTRDHKSYSVQAPCVICEANHAIHLTYKEMWSNEIVVLQCLDSEVDLGYLGREEAVREALGKKRTPFSEILSEAEYEEFFESPDVMWEVLSSLQEHANAGTLCCQCGNSEIEIDIFPEKVELRCGNCDSTMIIYGQTEEDARLIRAAGKVQLSRGSFTTLDGQRSQTRRGKK